MDYSFRMLITMVLLWNCMKNASAQVTCNASGNVVLFSNYDGGVLNINVDTNIPNLKIGVVSYEMVTINLSGPFVNNITEVRFAGYTTTTHHHCSNSPAVTSIVGAPPGTDTLVFLDASPVINPNGYNIIICNYSCDTSVSQGGCNTADQIAAYFQQEFGGLLRYHFTQYGCWNGTYNISDGGNCCVSALSPPPVALFTAPNNLCPGTCTDFTNLSTNAISYQWSFPGANPSASTDADPANICYSIPGNFPVTLIAVGAFGSDTITLNNYITVYPVPAPQGIQQAGDTLFSNTGFNSYQWYFNGIPIPGATDYFYVATQNGDYNIISTDQNGCEVEAVVFGVTTSIGAIRENTPRIRISPNPVSDRLQITVRDSLDINSIRIFSVQGALQHGSVSSEAGVAYVDLKSLDPGIYQVQLLSKEIVFRTLIIRK